VSRAILTGMAIACTVLTILGSTMFRTRRVWENGDGTVQSWSEGAARWAGLTFLCGLSALLVLLVAWWFGSAGHHGRAAVAGVIACGAFLVAASRGGENWRRLLTEREHPLEIQPSSDYVLTIAPGLPVGTACATLGTIVAFALALAYLWSCWALPRVNRPMRDEGSVRGVGGMG